MDSKTISLIYSQQANLYDLLYSSKNYKKETIIIDRHISTYKRTQGKRLLDVGCGSGTHIKYLQHKYECEGLDISPELLKIAKKQTKNARFYEGRMTNFKINKKYDVLICLFGVIGYVNSNIQFTKTLANFYNHLNPGGIVIIEPWFSKEDQGFKVDVPFMTTYEEANLKISRISIAKVKGDFSLIDTHYLLGNSCIQYFNEKEKLMLISHSKFTETMDKIGFKTNFLKKGLSQDDRGLYIGVK